MNRSGLSVMSVCSYFKIKPEEVLVAHDELDLSPGVVRLKQGGGHGGHNGLRDVIAHMGGGNFHRLRLGIGHPGNRQEVTDYVLGNPAKSEEAALELALDNALAELPNMMKGEVAAVMNRLNSNPEKVRKKRVDGE
jgi:PTH1 family peptidyl-tRNA hydrolase